MGHNPRAVSGTNVLLSGMAFAGSLPGKMLTAWRHGSLDVLLSPFIVGELRRVLPRLANRHGLTPAEMDDLVDLLAIQAEVIEPTTGQDVALRDTNDQPVLGTLLAAQAGEGVSYLT